MRVLIFQHVAGEHPAAFSGHIHAAGDQANIVRFFAGDPIPALEAFDALIVMGGPMDIWEVEANPWLVTEKAAIRRWVGELGKPYLGICLGHQLLVDAMGGQCGPLQTPAISVGPVEKTHQSDPIFDTFAPDFPTLQWHGVAAQSLPPDCVTLASTDSCPHQAIRLGETAWGVQFHPEITEGLVTQWLSDPENLEVAIDWLGSPQKATQFAKDCEAHSAAALIQSTALYAGLRDAVTQAK